MSHLTIAPDGLGCFDVNQDGKRISSFTTIAKAQKFIDNKKRKIENAKPTHTPAA